MRHFDQQSATCQVFTYKEGLLSAVGHDLKINVGRFTVDVDPGKDFYIQILPYGSTGKYKLSTKAG